VLARLGPITLVTFGLWAAVGWAFGGFVALARVAQAGLLVHWLVPVLAAGVPVLAILGSRLLEILVNIRAYVANPGRKLPETGFAFQGALVACTLALMAIGGVQGLPVLRLLDALVLGLPLGHAFGRLGCLAYGCCHGRPSSSRCAIRYFDPDSKPVWKEGLSGMPLHPTQLYSAMGNVALFLLLNGFAEHGPHREGTLAATYLLVNSSGRFGTEFLRWPLRGSRALKPFQWVSVALFCSGLAMLAWSMSHPGFDFSMSAGLWWATVDALEHLPFVLGGSGILFLGFGIHGRKVGRYFGQRDPTRPQ
jgi:phosphatidylglycerol:prolipoprotein diacylglycerol transferase